MHVKSCLHFWFGAKIPGGCGFGEEIEREGSQSSSKSPHISPMIKIKNQQLNACVTDTCACVWAQ